MARPVYSMTTSCFSDETEMGDWLTGC